MMMTSGTKQHYKSILDAGRQIMQKEGVKSLFKGAGYVYMQLERVSVYHCKISDMFSGPIS